MHKIETICALATAIGQSGIGVIRVSGPLSKVIANKVLNVELEPRSAHYGSFYDEESNQVDKGVAIYFSGPQSYTGEDVLELQGHGGMSVLRKLLETVIFFGARLSEPRRVYKACVFKWKDGLSSSRGSARSYSGKL